MHLMASHAIVFADDPPALDDVAALVGRLVEIPVRYAGLHRPDQESSELIDLRLRQIEVRHLQPVELGLLFAFVVNRRIFQLVFEEAFVRVPAFGSAAWPFSAKSRRSMGLEPSLVS